MFTDEYFFLVWGFIQLTSPEVSSWNILWAIVLGVCASYSSAAGILFWVVGFLVLLYRYKIDCDVNGLAVLIWGIVAALIYFTYLPTVEQSLLSGAGYVTPYHVPVWVVYTPIYIGIPVTGFRLEAALAIGLAGLFFGVWVHYSIWRAKKLKAMAVMPFTALMIFVVLTAAVTGLSKTKSNHELDIDAYNTLFDSAATRYTSFSTLYWVAVLFLLYLMAQKTVLGAGYFWESRWRRCAVTFAFIGIGAFSLLSSRQGYYSAQEFHDFFTPMVAEMVVGDEPGVTTRLQYPYGNTMPEAVAFLKKEELSIYRPSLERYWIENHARKEGLIVDSELRSR